MKKSKMVVCITLLSCMLLGFCGNNTVNAQEQVAGVSDEVSLEQAVKFVNSQDAEKFKLEDYVTLYGKTAKILVKNDGGYIYNVPGTYNVTYGFEGSDIEKTFPITVVESKGKIIETKVVGCNTIVLEDTLFTSNRKMLDSVFNTKVDESFKVICTVMNIDESISYIETGIAEVTDWGSGAIVSDNRHSYTLRNSDLGTQPVMAKEAKNATYSNGWKSVRQVKNTVRINAVGNDTIQNNEFTSEDGRIIIKGQMPMLKDLKVEVLYHGNDYEKMASYSIFVKMSAEGSTEGDIPYFQVGPVTMSLTIPENTNPKKLSVYRILPDDTRENMNGEINGNKIEFVTTNMAGGFEVFEDKTDAEIVPAPTIIEGTNSTWKQGDTTSLLLRSNASFASFTGVMVDGVLIDQGNYTTREGSIIIELKPQYLATLSAGKHAISINSTEGNAVTEITIENKSKGSGIVRTGDSSALSINVFVITMLSIVFVVNKRRNKEIND